MPFISIVSAASPRGFTTRAAVKAALNIADDVETYDAHIDRLIGSVSNTIERITDRVWPADRVSESIPGGGDFYLLLARRPIIEVHSVTQDGSTVSPSAYSINAEAGALYNQSGWAYSGGRYGLSEFPLPGSGAPTIVVNYTAGYIMPGTVDPDNEEAFLETTLPEGLQEIAIRAVHLLLAPLLEADGEIPRDPNIKAERLGDASISYGMAAGDSASFESTLRGWLHEGRWIGAPYVGL